MEDRRTSPSRPRPVPGASDSSSVLESGQGSPLPGSQSRYASISRLATPIPSHPVTGAPTPDSRRPSQLPNDAQLPLAGAGGQNSLPGPGRSALAAALEGAYGKSPHKLGTPSARGLSPISGEGGQVSQSMGRQSPLGSVDIRQGRLLERPSRTGLNEDPDIVRRHLVQSPNHTGRSNSTLRRRASSRSNETEVTSDVRSTRKGKRRNVRMDMPENEDDEFSSLRLQGGDMTRQVYKWAEDAEQLGRGKRSKSFHINRPEPESEIYDINSIRVPGGFRRNFLHRAAEPSNIINKYDGSNPHSNYQGHEQRPMRPFTRSFIEFLTLYGHFAGEELEDDDELLEPGDYFSHDEALDTSGDSDSERESMEGNALLTPRTPGGRRRPRGDRSAGGQTSPMGAALLLLKSFVGTGVLFLPKAYKNGGMLFSNVVLLTVALLSYYCFILLVNTRLKINGSFGDIGGIVYGPLMRNLILTSIVLSQIGFVAAYIVFTSENLKAFTLAVSDCRYSIEIRYLILMQLIIFLPLSLIRDISKLGITALVADFFILLGLVYLYYYDILTLVKNHGVSDIVQFNPQNWPLFIGTAIFTFEGIGLIIPIQESMKKPAKFPKVLAYVMFIIIVVFMSMGALSYAAYGSSTRTVIILNLPQDDRFVNTVQLLYAMAILLSTPLQLFPAIRIMENELFRRSGKHSRYIKWQKNAFRFFLVVMCALIAWGGAGDLDKFVSLIGSFACIPLVFIYPVSEFPLPNCNLTDGDIVYASL